MIRESFNRLVLVTSLDGRIAFANGGKGDIGGKGDRKVLEQSLAWADATLMGSKTLKSHKNTCIIHNQKLIEKRLNNHLKPQPLSIIVSKKKSFPSSLEYFNQPIKRGLLSPVFKTDDKSEEHFDYYFLMGETWSETFQSLNKEGYRNILILGGINLIESILKEDQIDELQLTVTSRIIGGEYTWISPKMNNIPIELNQIDSWELEKVEKLDNSEVMLKYLRKRI